MLHCLRAVVAALFCLFSTVAAAQVAPPTAAQLEEARKRPAPTFPITWSDSSVRGTETLWRCLEPGTGYEDDDAWEGEEIGFLNNQCSFNIRLRFGPGWLDGSTCKLDSVVVVQEITALANGSVTWGLSDDDFECIYDASVLGVARAEPAAAKPAPPSPSEIAQKTLSDMAATGTIEIRNQERHNDAETWFMWRQASGAKATSACFTEYAANQINKRSDNVTNIATTFSLDWAQVHHVELNGRFVLIIGKWMKEGEFAAFYHASEADAKRGHDAMAALRDAC